MIRRCLVALALMSAGCVSQDPGLELTVEVRLLPLPDGPVPTPAGAARIEQATLTIDRLLIEPCPEAVAADGMPRQRGWHTAWHRAWQRDPLSWLIGRAEAHGEALHRDDASVLPVDTVLSAGAEAVRWAGAQPVPPDHPICAVVLVLTQPIGAELAAGVDGADGRWPMILPPIRRPIEPVSLDAAHRAARIVISSDPARWLDGLADASDEPLATRLAHGIRDGLEVVVQH